MSEKQHCAYCNKQFKTSDPDRDHCYDPKCEALAKEVRELEKNENQLKYERMVSRVKS